MASAAGLDARVGVESASFGHPPCGRLRIGGERFFGERFVGVLAQDHPGVVLPFCEQATGRGPQLRVPG